MWAHPGKQLLFMGSELGQEAEWAEDRSLDWWLQDKPGHAGLHSWSGTSTASTARAALWSLDFDPRGLRVDRRERLGGNTFSFLRLAPTTTAPSVLACIANFSGSPHDEYRVGPAASPAAGTRSSTPTPRATAAPASATSAPSRPRRSPGTAALLGAGDACRRWARCGWSRPSPSSPTVSRAAAQVVPGTVSEEQADEAASAHGTSGRTGTVSGRRRTASGATATGTASGASGSAGSSGGSSVSEGAGATAAGGGTSYSEGPVGDTAGAVLPAAGSEADASAPQAPGTRSTSGRTSEKE